VCSVNCCFQLQRAQQQEKIENIIKNKRYNLKTKKMGRETYSYISKLMGKIPANKKTPIGQKFHIGEIVKISNPNSWFAENSFNKDKERLYEIEYSYDQKYGGGGRGIEIYSLKHLFEDNSSSWYDESELELVKGIDEINEEKDLAEYNRLKEKYGDA